jgi:uncharacterized protein
MRARAIFVFAAVIIGLDATTLAYGDSLSAGRAAFARAEYSVAARLLRPSAERGNAHAQMMLGFMHANGRGVPQSYDAAAYWYRMSADQGNAMAQFQLGLMYDKGQGVPLDEVVAYMWLNLATAAAPRHDRDNFQRLRDAVASKMTRSQIEAGQQLALGWAPGRRY